MDRTVTCGAMGVSHHGKALNMDSPFHLVYGSGAILPKEFIVPALRTKSIEDEINDQLLSPDNVLMDET